MFGHRSMLPALALAAALGLIAGPGAWAQNATNLKCKKCVGKGEIAKKAVTGREIKNGSVAFGDLNPAVRKLITDLQAQVNALQGQLAAAQGDIATLQGDVGTAQGDIGALETRVSVAESDIVDLQIGNAALPFLQFLTDLESFVTIDEVDTDLDGNGTISANEMLPRVLFEGVNVQVVNGDVSQATNSRNGLGNLVVGYNEPRNGGSEVCSDGSFDTMITCEPANVWARNHKSGSHNLVVGPNNAYSRTGGVVFGEQNAINRFGATITGGLGNVARGLGSSVGGGENNTAMGTASAVGGGDTNTANGPLSSITGGQFNMTLGQASSVGGGTGNTAQGSASSVTGGLANEARGPESSVTGGSSNLASGGRASVSAGNENEARAEGSSVSGGKFEIIAGACQWGGTGMIFGGGCI